MCINEAYKTTELKFPEKQKFKLLHKESDYTKIVMTMHMVGKTISHYRILEQVGQGGMGIVYKAEDLKLKRAVALKFLPSEMKTDQQNAERFFHEARAASALDHPNICTIHDIGETEDGQNYMVMACYEGQTLREYLQDDILPMHETLDIILQIASGLAAAHEKGIIHRDVKPENIMITSNGTVKILDFGLAKLTGQSQLTISGTTLGTAAYMSPEQARGDPVNQQSDIFSFTVILYEMLAGLHPFRAEHQLAMMYSIVNEVHQPIRELKSDIPLELESIINKGLEKALDNRYKYLEEMISNLKNIRTSLESSIRKEDIEGSPVKSKKGHFPIAELLAEYPRLKYAFAFVFLIVALSILYFVYKGSDNTVGIEDKKLAKTHVNQALSALNQNDLELAKKELEFAIYIDPSYSIAWSTLAAVNIQLNNISSAIDQSQRAIGLDGQNTSAYYNLAYAQEEQGEDESALENYAKAVEIDSLFTRAYSALGNLYLKLEQPQRAIDILERALIKTPQSEYLFLIYKNLGKAFYIQGFYEKAIEYLNLSIESDPVKRPETLNNLAFSYQKAGKITESIKTWKLYIEVEKDSVKRKQAQTHLQELEK